MLNLLLAGVLSIPPIPSAAETVKDVVQINVQEEIEAVRSPEPLPEPEPMQTPGPKAERPLESKPSSPRIAISARQQRIARCEGYPDYVNRSHPGSSSASGKYGYLDGTWNDYKGYNRAMHAPEWVQDQRAASDLAQFGPGAWNASRHCWG